MSRTRAVVGSALNINPMLKLDDSGNLIVREKKKVSKKAKQRIYYIINNLAI